MKVIGIELYDKGLNSAVDEFKLLARQEPKNLLVSPSDANVLVQTKRNIDFKRILEQYFWNLPDGMPSVWIMRLKGAKATTRCCGPDFFERIILETKNLPINHFLCGGAEHTAIQLKDKCIEWGNHNISGTYSPPFKALSETEIMDIANIINLAETNILWVGLGAPKQIYFSHRISKYTNVQFIVPIGAGFDFHTGKIKKAPQWIQKSGMEWFYRICQEPKRLLKRYLSVIPRFIFYNITDFSLLKSKK